MRYKKIFYFLSLIGLIISLIFSSAAFADLTPEDQAKNKFINTMVKQHHFRKSYLRKLLAHFSPDPTILAAISRPFESQPWYIYRTHFLTPQRITDGVEYWRRHATELRYAEQTYGVPAELIVSIVGVESNYGMTTLRYPVLSSLATLSFYYPPRASFFAHELSQYLLLTRELGINPLAVHGSYAGAIGLPQFMPSSYRKFAVAYKNRTRKDLIHDTPDVIVSVANYFKQFGWRAHEPIVMPALVVGDKYNLVVANGTEPKLSGAQLAEYGVFAGTNTSIDYPAAIITLEAAEQQYEHWLVFHNFNVILRYNGSNLYAMAVTQLAEAIKAAREDEGNSSLTQITK